MKESPRLEYRHSASGLNTQFNGDHLPFADYVTLTQNMIRQVRLRAGSANLEKIVDGNSPFELKPASGYQAGLDKPYRRGILLTHGLTDSPYFMRYLAAFYQEQGFRVMAILLPGHGTQPGDLLDVTWQEWAKAVAYGTDRLATEVNEVYLAGYSAGCALSIYQSLQDARVCGLFLFSPALEVSPRAAKAHRHKLYSWLMPSAKWVNIRPDRDIYKYESFPKNAATQVYALTQAVRSALQHRELTIPVFTATSLDDTTAIVAGTLEFMARASHPNNKLILYTTDTKKIPQNFPPEKLELVNSMFPAQKILSSSHTAVVLPPDDPHYGMEGDYSNCVHYYPNNMEKYQACNSQASNTMQGEITEENLKLGVVRRLMFNPNFIALKNSLNRFISNMP